MTIKVGDYVVVKATWLETCGMTKFTGKPWRVTRVQDFGARGVMYNVAHRDCADWVVWSVRGVTKV